MNLSNRIYTKELLDRDDIPFADIQKNMQELSTINSLLGGHKITIDGVKAFAKNCNSDLTICEIGCGGGDNMEAIAKAFKHTVNLRFIGVDIKQECIDFARNKPANNYAAEWIAADYKTVEFTRKPDIIFSSLFCHHFNEPELAAQLQWMKANSRLGFFINDLQRHPLAYYSIRLLTRLFSRSYLVKNDAPLSVARGFIKKEWEQLFSDAGVNNYSIQWKWAFRYLILCRNG